MRAAARGDAQQVEEMLQRPQHPDECSAVARCRANVVRAAGDTTPLICAAQCGHVSVVRLLLEAGAATDRAHQHNLTTALAAAFAAGHADVAQVLKEAVAQRGEADNSSKMALALEQGGAAGEWGDIFRFSSATTETPVVFRLGYTSKEDHEQLH